METAGTYSGGGHSTEQGERLARRISPRMLLFFVLGDILGAGIYIRVGSVARDVGGAIWVSFLFALVLAALTAASYAELVTKYPGAGGAPLYTNKAFRNPFFTFVIAFIVLASGIASACAAARSFGGRYMDRLLTLESNELRTLAIAALFVLVIALINFRGVSESVKTNIALTLIELSGLLLIILIGAVALFGGHESVDTSRPLTFKQDANLALAVLAGAATAFYALLGFEDAVNMSEETQDVRRTFPRALFGGLLAAGIIYLLVSFTASMIVPTNILADPENTGPLVSVVERGPLGIPTRFYSLIALIAITNTALLNMIMASRVVYGMARQGVMPAVLARTHASRRTPYIAIMLTTAVALLLVTWGTVSTLADTTTGLLLLVFTLVNVAVLVLKRDRVDRPHFSVPSILPLLGALVCPILFVQLLLNQDDPTFFAIMGGLIALGVVLGVVNFLIGGGRRSFDAAQLET